MSNPLSSPVTESTPPPEESWKVAQGTNNGRPLFLRVNIGLKPVAGKPPFDHRFGVAVPLRAPNEHGLPAKDESVELNRIEDTLTAAFTQSGKTFFALAITTSGYREFVFYTCVPKDVIPEMERITKETTSHALQFYVKPDLIWSVYQAFAK